MPRRTKKDEDPEDLQTFLNNFHKEIEGNSDEKVVNTILEAISAEAIDLDENGAEAGGSKPMEEAEADLDHAEEAEEEEEDELSSVLVGGVVFVLEKYGKIIFEHVINAESFESLINIMANKLDPKVFDHIMLLTRTFMDTMLEDLTSVLKFFISTESVLYRILLYILRNFEDVQLSVIADHTCEIVEAVRVYFMSLNPNAFPGLLQKCPKCIGHFSVCPL